MTPSIKTEGIRTEPLQRPWRVDPRVYVIYLGSSFVLGGSGPPLIWIENVF